MYTGGVSLVHTGGVSCAQGESHAQVECLLCAKGECLVHLVNIEAFFAGNEFPEWNKFCPKSSL